MERNKKAEINETKEERKLGKKRMGKNQRSFKRDKLNKEAGINETKEETTQGKKRRDGNLWKFRKDKLNKRHRRVERTREGKRVRHPKDNYSPAN